MKIEQKKWTPSAGWQLVKGNLFDNQANLVFVFAYTDFFKNPDNIAEIRAMYPKSILAGCSTSGEIADTQVLDGSVSLTAVHFDKTRVVLRSVSITDSTMSFRAGQELGNLFEVEDLVHVLLISDGLKVNGTELLEGLKQSRIQHIKITGGMAGDMANFRETYVLDEQGNAAQGIISAIGFYSKDLKISYGSMGGWDSFGTERTITKSSRNILYELDGQPALSIYKTYLGEQAAHLPGSALLFPLNMRTKADTTPVVRTILGIDESSGSMTFAGDMPMGATVRLMKANMDRLIDGAEDAARIAIQSFSEKPELAILISCVGRKLVMKQLVEEEVEAVQSVLSNDTYLTGFYSYGEICPFDKSGFTELHNQTMTITVMKE